MYGSGENCNIHDYCNAHYTSLAGTRQHIDRFCDWAGSRRKRSETSDGAVFSNADYVGLIAPLTSKVGVNTYGFYLGNLGVNIALAEVPIALQKHLLLTPSYLYVNVPPSGLSLLTTKSAYRMYRENQVRIESHSTYTTNSLPRRLAGVSIDEIINQHWNVRLTLAQGRHCDGKNVKPIVEYSIECRLCRGIKRKNSERFI